MAVFEERRAGSNTLLRAVIDTTVDGMVIVDRAGTMKVFNHAAEKLFGYSADEMIGRNVSILMSPGDHHRSDDSMRNDHQTGRRKDGSDFPMEFSLGEVKGGSDLAYIGIIRDLTEKKRSFAALVDATERAELASNAKSEFLARMSHELRTPMNAIMGFTQLLLMTPKETITVAQHDDYLTSILEPARHLAGLIDDILDVVRIETGRPGVSLEKVVLREVIEQSVAIVQPMAERCGICLLIEAEQQAEAALVLADPLRLRQCVVNLLTNAVKYSRPEGAVRISTISGPDIVRLTVADTGVGIPPDQLGDLFVPFKRLNQEHKEIAGVGIGLALVKQLVEAMHGTVSVENALTGGARFHIDLVKAGAPEFPQLFPMRDPREGHTALARPAPHHRGDRSGSGDRRCVP